MPFTDHKIASFTHRIADLPDEPNLSAAELKARFDSAPEQLRQAHNAACDAAARLDERVEQQTTHLSERITQLSLEKFPDDTIEERHLHTDLAEKLNGKAEESTVAARLAAETEAREATDEALQSQITAHGARLLTKCQVLFGTYTGDDAASRTIDLGCKPVAVLLIAKGSEFSKGSTGLTVGDRKVTTNVGATYLKIVENGFIVACDTEHNCRSNLHSTDYFYIAFVNEQ